MDLPGIGPVVSENESVHYSMPFEEVIAEHPLSPRLSGQFALLPEERSPVSGTGLKSTREDHVKTHYETNKQCKHQKCSRHGNSDGG